MLKAKKNIHMYFELDLYLEDETIETEIKPYLFDPMIIYSILTFRYKFRYKKCNKCCETGSS